MNLFIYTGATDLTEANVTSSSNLTSVDIGQLVAGDTPTFLVKFLSGASAFESWSGGVGYTMTLSLGFPSSAGALLYATNSTFTAVANGWSGTLALTSTALANAIAAVLGCNPRRSGVTMTLQVSVTDASSNRVTYAELPVFVRALIGVSGQAQPA